MLTLSVKFRSVKCFHGHFWCDQRRLFGQLTNDGEYGAGAARCKWETDNKVQRDASVRCVWGRRWLDVWMICVAELGPNGSLGILRYTFSVRVISVTAPERNGVLSRRRVSGNVLLRRCSVRSDVPVL